MLNKRLLAAITIGAPGNLAAGQAYAADPVSIVYIPKNTGNPYFDSIIKGFEDGCKELGCTFAYGRPGDRRGNLADPLRHRPDPARRRRPDDLAEQPGRAQPDLRSRPQARHADASPSIRHMPVATEEHRDAAILPVDFTKTGPDEVELDGLAHRL